MTHFVQWRCNIFVKQSQTNYSYLAHSDKNCSWAGHSCPSKQLGYTFIPVNLPQSIKRMFVAKMIKQHWIKHIVSRTEQRFSTTCKSKIFIKQFFFTVLQYLTFIKQSYNDNHRNKKLVLTSYLRRWSGGNLTSFCILLKIWTIWILWNH